MRWVVLGGAYVILWWTALFVLLPIGLHNEDDPPGEFKLGVEPKTPSSAHKPRLLLKIAGATVVASVFWGIFYVLVMMNIVRL